MDPVFETESETYSLVRRIDTWNLNAVDAGMLDADMSRGVTWSISLGDGADARRQSSRCSSSSSSSSSGTDLFEMLLDGLERYKLELAMASTQDYPKSSREEEMAEQIEVLKEALEKEKKRNSELNDALETLRAQVAQLLAARRTD
ncbi:hypothetical protein TorRG33x02_209090 [Trema orientale]|uniref:Uncharacterized protein n=1 Tax=Trema orientale TaxID=63057 RepID=A0A2P5ECR9_TREOI|nr:hypothetical protein TorRG33x02_209090 [Trema orientale]